MNKNISILQRKGKSFGENFQLHFLAVFLLYLYDLEKEEGNYTVVPPADFLYIHVEQNSFKLLDIPGKHMTFRKGKLVG